MGNAIEKSGYTPAQLSTIRQTVARDANDTEFNLFVEAARAYGLDPFRKQISIIIYNKDKPEKRSHAIIVGRDGLRVMASRSGDYRPASEPPEYLTDPDHASPTNPLGIVCARVKLHKQDTKTREWFPVMGEAYWDEFAPIVDEWAFDQEAGKRQPTGNKTLQAGNWTKMPRLMIAKCAEAQALRAGWPETYSGLYVEEEMSAAHADHTATEELEAYERAEREKRIGGPGLMFVFDDTAKLQKVPIGQVFDRVDEFVRSSDPVEVHKFRVRNEDALREFWAHEKAAALKLRTIISEKEAERDMSEADA